MFVAVGFGDDNTIAYSNDGINWIGAGLIFSTTGRGIAWNNERWVAVGEGGNRIAYSNDGISWTSISTSNSVFSSICEDVSWDGRRWIAVGGGTNTIATSNDGITWYGVSTSLNLFTDYGQGLSSNYNASSSQLVVSNTSGTTLSNQLDIISDAYYNQGPTEFALRITTLQ
jgi:hypothetical protein